MVFFAIPILAFVQNAFATTNENPPLSNGAVAYAYPVKGITIDGKPEEWPSGLTQYPIRVTPYGENPKPDDFEASFQVGYSLDEKSLYLLVRVKDDDHFIDSSDTKSWNTQDTYNLYVDPRHSFKGSGVSLFQFAQNLKDSPDDKSSWDPSSKEFTWENVEIQMSRKNNTTIYEVQLRLGDHLKIGKPIGVDHVLMDKDSDDENAGTFVSWGPEGGKSQSAVRLGDIIPLEVDKGVSSLKGLVKWKDTSINEMTDRVRLISTKSPELWTVAEVDSTGKYNVELPEGNYEIKPFWHLRNKHRIDIEDSSAEATIAGNRYIEAPELVLKTRDPLNLIASKGILLDFDPKSSHSVVDDFITSYQEYYGIPGVSLALIKDGKLIYHKTYGVKNAYTGEAVKNETLFEAASITKPVFAFAVCRLMERNIIDIDRPLYTYLPFEEIAHDERYKLITARHVLSHQTGFPNWASNNEDGKIDIKFTPGTDYGYSGEGFEYLKRVVREITGKDTQTVLEEEVLGPLNLQNTYFSENEYLSQVVSNGHFGNYPTRATLPKEPGMAWSMHTEARSFTSFALGLLNKKGMKPETYEEMFKIQTTIPQEDEDIREGWEDYFGLGIFMQKTPFGPAFGHGGNNGDFKCQFVVYPELNAGFIVFTNSNTGDFLHDDLNEFLITGKLD